MEKRAKRSKSNCFRSPDAGNRNGSFSRSLVRQRIAQAAARIMAEDGIQDFSLAKRKAARQLGVEDGQHLPNNQEIEQELRLYQEIFQKEEQQERLQFLRKLALEVMRQLEPFNPRLTGSVLSGTATRYSDINLEVFPSSLKDVELFLLGRKIPYRSGEKTLRQGKDVRTVPLLALVELPATVEILVYDAEDLRSLPKTAADGKSPLRVKIHQVEAWLKGEAENHEG